MPSGYQSLPQSIGAVSGVFYRAKSSTQSIFATRRPWRELFAHPTSYFISYSFPRINRNFNHFRVNYAMIILFILFLSLLYHPISMIVFIIIFTLWFFLYFSRDEPIVVFNRMVDDRVVLIALGIVTIVSLVLTRVWFNVLVSVSIGIVLVTLHAAFRVTEDLFLDEEEEVAYGGGGGLVSVVGTRF